MSFKRNLISNVIFQIFNILLAFCISVIVARALGPEYQGKAAFFLLIITTISEFGNIGVNNSFVYFLKKSDYSSEEVLGTNLIFLLLDGALIFLVLSILRISGMIFSAYSIITFSIGAISIIFAYLTAMSSELYVAREEVYKLNIYLIVFKGLRLLTLASLYVVGKLNMDLYLIIMGLVSILEGLTLYLSVKNYYSFIFKFNFRFFKVEMKYAIKMILAYLFIYLNYKVDQIFIKVMIDDYQLGLYSVAVYLAELLFLIPTCINSALIGKIVNMKTDFAEVIIKTIKITFNLSILLCLIGCLCTNLVPIVYGQEYATIKITIIILFIGIIFASIGKVGYTYFTMNNKPEIHMYISLLTLISNLIGNFILIPLMGINGAATASSISYILYGIIYVIIINKFEKVSYSNILFINIEDLKEIKKIIKASR